MGQPKKRGRGRPRVKTPRIQIGFWINPQTRGTIAEIARRLTGGKGGRRATRGRTLDLSVCYVLEALENGKATPEEVLAAGARAGLVQANAGK